jgi:hypothetical protein
MVYGYGIGFGFGFWMRNLDFFFPVGFSILVWISVSDSDGVVLLGFGLAWV